MRENGIVRHYATPLREREGSSFEKEHMLDIVYLTARISNATCHLKRTYVGYCGKHKLHE